MSLLIGDKGLVGMNIIYFILLYTCFACVIMSKSILTCPYDGNRHFGESFLFVIKLQFVTSPVFLTMTLHSTFTVISSLLI